MKKLETIAEIKTAIDAGLTVKCDNGNYTAFKDSIGQYLIRFDYSDYCIGLHGMAGTEYENSLNGKNFYVDPAGGVEYNR